MFSTSYIKGDTYGNLNHHTIGVKAFKNWGSREERLVG